MNHNRFKMLPGRLNLLSPRAVAVIAVVMVIGIGTLVVVKASGIAGSVETESGTLTGAATSLNDSAASGGRAVQFGTGATSSAGWPDATNRPHISGSNVLAYTDANGTAQQLTLKSLPAPGSNFGTNSSGTANSCAFYDPRGWITISTANCVIDGYNFNGIPIGDLSASNITISRNWFHNIDGQDSWAVWVHAHGSLSGLTITDNLVQGTSTTKTGPDGLLKMDGSWSNVKVERNHSFNCSSFVQFVDILGSGSAPYGNIVADNYMEVISDPSNFGLHLEQINVSSGTGGLLISHNHITGPSGQTASIYTSHDDGNVGHITIDNNLLDGKPQNTIYGGDTGAANGSLLSTAGNFKITNNKFANTNGQNPGGYVIEPGPGDSRLSVTGNVSYPSLSPISGM